MRSEKKIEKSFWEIEKSCCWPTEERVLFPVGSVAGGHKYACLQKKKKVYYNLVLACKLRSDLVVSLTPKSLNQRPHGGCMFFSQLIGNGRAQVSCQVFGYLTPVDSAYSKYNQTCLIIICKLGLFWLFLMVLMELLLEYWII